MVEATIWRRFQAQSTDVVVAHHRFEAIRAVGIGRIEIADTCRPIWILPRSIGDEAIVPLVGRSGLHQHDTVHAMGIPLSTQVFDVPGTRGWPMRFVDHGVAHFIGTVDVRMGIDDVFAHEVSLRYGGVSIARSAATISSI